MYTQNNNLKLYIMKEVVKMINENAPLFQIIWTLEELGIKYSIKESFCFANNELSFCGLTFKNV